MASEDEIRRSKEYQKRLEQARAQKQLSKDLAKEEAAEQKKINASLSTQLVNQLKLNDLKKEAKLNTENIVKGFISANDQIVKFQKTLGLSVKESAKFTKELGLATIGSRNLAVNLQNAGKAVGVINKGLGTGTRLFNEQAIDAGRFAVSLGLSILACSFNSEIVASLNKASDN